VRLAHAASVLSALALLAAGISAGPAAATAPPPTLTGLVAGSYNALTPAQLFDSRSGLDTAKAVLGPNAQRVATVPGHVGVPTANVAAIAVTITALSGTAPGSITVWADGATKPATSSVSFAKGVNRSNLTVVQIGGSGRIRFANNSTGSVHVVGVISGYYVAGTPTAPGTTNVTPQVRALDTRTTLGGHHGPVAAHSTFSVPIGGHTVPAGAAAVIITVTVLSPAAAGTLTVWNAGPAHPSTVNLSLSVGNSIANLAVVPLGSGGAISMWNNTAGALNIVAAVSGYVVGGTAVEGGTTTATTPTRALDTRTTLGGHPGALAANSSYGLPVTARAGVPATNVTAVVVTVTVVAPSVGGGVIVWADGYGRPTSGAMAFAARQSSSALVVAPVGPDGKIALNNASGAGVQVVADIVGYVRADRLPIVASTSRYVRNLTGTSADASTMHDEGCTDAQAAATGIQHLVLLDIGGQYTVGGVSGVKLSAINTPLTDTQLVTALQGYVDGYVSCRSGTDPITVAIATNNDGDLRTGPAGTDWADHVVEPVAANVAGAVGVTVAGANDIEPGFTGLESEAEAWTRAFLAATSAPYVFVGAASGCPTGSVGGTCEFGWTQRNFYNLAHGIAPTRILALPQVYYQPNAAQWRYISQAGASGPDRIGFIGSLSEYAACQTSGSGCDLTGLLTAPQSWQALRDALSGSPAVGVQQLPVSTDLRIDTAPGAPLSAKRVTTAGVH